MESVVPNFDKTLGHESLLTFAFAETTFQAPTMWPLLLPHAGVELYMKIF